MSVTPTVYIFLLTIASTESVSLAFHVTPLEEKRLKMDLPVVNQFSFLVNGGYTEWNNWGPCSVTCDKGIKTRQRFCTNPEPAYGGVGCGHLGSAEETVQCYDVNCPSNCFVDRQLSIT